LKFSPGGLVRDGGYFSLDIRAAVEFDPDASLTRYAINGESEFAPWHTLARKTAGGGDPSTRLRINASFSSWRSAGIFLPDSTN
jgi:hypothetical protein